eukprot:COSAG02_NODE_1254_length_13584_cov_15.001483_13_plen_97_part_00
MHTCMPRLTVQIYATYPYYAQPLASIMPGQTWRDNGHKGLMPVITIVRQVHQSVVSDCTSVTVQDCIPMLLQTMMHVATCIGCPTHRVRATDFDDF